MEEKLDKVIELLKKPHPERVREAIAIIQDIKENGVKASTKTIDVTPKKSLLGSLTGGE